MVLAYPILWSKKCDRFPFPGMPPTTALLTQRTEPQHLHDTGVLAQTVAVRTYLSINATSLAK
ncbi:hypothetical protein CKA32_003978 [Geitlerinema sp. FC II]|nr:hypothetical protein CKA32_003978 [Geitlerinema sp. FC II]